MKKDSSYVMIEDKPIVFYDVDDTLVVWNDQSEDAVKFNAGAYNVFAVPHKKHIQLMKEFKARGFTIVVWSQGGSQWAESVIKTLALESVVDIIMPKPYWYVDDLHVTRWMTDDKRVYYEQKSEPKKSIAEVADFINDESWAKGAVEELVDKSDSSFLLDKEKGEL